MITGLRHIGYAVNSIDEHLKRLREQFGATEIDRRTFPAGGQTSALIQIGDMVIELMEPFGHEGVVPKYLEKHGEGFHHISLRSDDLEADRKRLEETGVTILGNGDTFFTHPRSTGGIVYEIAQD